MCIYIYTYNTRISHIHTYIHTIPYLTLHYINLHLHYINITLLNITLHDMHACMHASMHPCMHASMHPCIHAYMHTCMHPCIHAYMHTCIHAYSMHPCIHAYMHTYRQTDIHTFRGISLWIIGRIFWWCARMPPNNLCGGRRYYSSGVDKRIGRGHRRGRLHVGLLAVGWSVFLFVMGCNSMYSRCY